MVTLHEVIRTFMIIARLILLSMRNVREKCCRENQNRRFVFKVFFSENRAVYENVEKYCRAGQVTEDKMAQVLCVLDN